MIASHDMTRKRKRERDARSDKIRGSARERGYSSYWDRFAKGFLARRPLCLYCDNQNRVTPADLVDHIVPHGGDSASFWPEGDADENFAACCTACHNRPKARAEFIAVRDGKNVKNVLVEMGMLPPGFPGVDPGAWQIRNNGGRILCGPPCAGKTTAAQVEWTLNGGVIYDLDDIAVDILGFPRFGRSLLQVNKCVRMRDRMLEAHPPGRRIIFIVSAPTSYQRAAWGNRMGIAPEIINPGKDECIRRLKQSAARAPFINEQMNAIERWYERAN